MGQGRWGGWEWGWCTARWGSGRGRCRGCGERWGEGGGGMARPAQAQRAACSDASLACSPCMARPGPRRSRRRPRAVPAAPSGPVGGHGCLPLRILPWHPAPPAPTLGTATCCVRITQARARKGWSCWVPLPACECVRACVLSLRACGDRRSRVRGVPARTLAPPPPPHPPTRPPAHAPTLAGCARRWGGRRLPSARSSSTAPRLWGCWRLVLPCSARGRWAGCWRVS